MAGGGMGGVVQMHGALPAPLLPFAGGVADQPACVIAALSIMDGAYEALRPKKT